MKNSTVLSVTKVIDYIEGHLDCTLNLNTVSKAVAYSKYHLHRMFVQTVGMTLHDYVLRRRLTEAAKLLVFSGKPIIEIALLCGYESQQAFSVMFKYMYKVSPARYRKNSVFYPLQLRFSLHRNVSVGVFTTDDIVIANRSDIKAWMDLMHLVIDGYPVMNESEYQSSIIKHIDEGCALVLKDKNRLIGALAFCKETGCIDFLGVHPQYKNAGIQKLFLHALAKRYLPDREISMTTFREGDKADTGYRDLLKQLGFAERELLVEFGYPTQRFVYLPHCKEETQNEKAT